MRQDLQDAVDALSADGRKQRKSWAEASRYLDAVEPALAPTEQVVAIIPGRAVLPTGLSGALLVLTDHRVHAISPLGNHAWALAEVNGSRLGQGFAGAASLFVTLRTGDLELNADGAFETEMRRFAEQFQRCVSHATAPARPAPTPAADPASRQLVADELVKLAALRDQGLLTDEEFNTQKLRLLGS